MASLLEQELYNILCFCDTNHKKIGTVYNGYDIVDINEAIDISVKTEDICIFIAVVDDGDADKISRIISDSFPANIQVNAHYRFFYRYYDIKKQLDLIWKQLNEIPNNLGNAINLKTIKKSNPEEELFLKLDDVVWGKEDFDNSIQGLKQQVPNAYDIYAKLFENGSESYNNDEGDSLTTENNYYFNMIHEFLNMYIMDDGNILDIGCGIEGCPEYLRNFNDERIFGIDPLPLSKDSSKNFKQAVAEKIPFGNDFFRYALFITSLDHVLLLDKAIEEVKRVLEKGGYLLIATSPAETNVPYNPYDKNVAPVDRFHMFKVHPDWFEKWMKNDWEKIACYVPDRGMLLYVFRKR